MPGEQKKVALFVDFDNIYLGLRETSREAAEAFATRPQTWLRWIEQGMGNGSEVDDEQGASGRRILIRRCYLNPDSFGRYRGYFTRSGFSVVDCPSLTSRAKNSSDIVMVMDILDALRHETRFDEFVIMSADADFTPVLQRLRTHDRQTAVLVSGQAAPAYRAACDRLITEDMFIDLALEIAPQPEPQRTTPPALLSAPPVAPLRDSALLASMAHRIYEEASSSGILAASELPRILREFKEFTPKSHWLGHYSLRSLTEAILAQRTDLRITDDDPWRVAVQVPDEAAVPADEGQAPSPATTPEGDWDAVRDRVVQVVARMVAESPEPVVMGRAAQAAQQEIGPLLTETQWLGRSTFKNLLLSAGELPFQVVASPLPGFLYDLARHQQPSDRTVGDGLGELGAEMASFIRRINQLTDAPKLTPQQYSVLFRVIANELGRAPYNVMGTGKAVRDQCVERGVPISRQSVTTVLRGLAYAGYKFARAAHRPENVADAYRGNLLNQLRRAQVTLGEDELLLLDEWLLGQRQTLQPGAQAPADDVPLPGHGEPDPAPAVDEAAGLPGSEPDYAAWAEALLAQDAVPSPEQADAAARPAGDAAQAGLFDPEPDAAPGDAPWAGIHEHAAPAEAFFTPGDPRAGDAVSEEPPAAEHSDPGDSHAHHLEADRGWINAPISAEDQAPGADFDPPVDDRPTHEAVANASREGVDAESTPWNGPEPGPASADTVEPRTDGRTEELTEAAWEPSHDTDSAAEPQWVGMEPAPSAAGEADTPTQTDAALADAHQDRVDPLHHGWGAPQEDGPPPQGDAFTPYWDLLQEEAPKTSWIPAAAPGADGGTDRPLPIDAAAAGEGDERGARADEPAASVDLRPVLAAENVDASMPRPEDGIGEEEARPAAMEPAGSPPQSTQRVPEPPPTPPAWWQ
jgi:hypothetical protein